MTSESDLRPPIGLFRLSLVAIFVGIVTGFGAIAFRGLIGFIHNLLFLGHFSFFYDAKPIRRQVLGAPSLSLCRSLVPL